MSWGDVVAALHMSAVSFLCGYAFGVLNERLRQDRLRRGR